MLHNQLENVYNRLKIIDLFMAGLLRTRLRAMIESSSIIDGRAVVVEEMGGLWRLRLGW